MAQESTSVSNEDVIIVGAGPSGLTAALELCKGGKPPLILEQDGDVGGLMKSLTWGDYTVDLGRKELYSRFPEIDSLWSEILKNEYSPYPHRIGSLYKNRILELSGKYRGPLRGIPFPWLVNGGFSLALGWVASIARPVRSYQDYWYFRVGRVFARLLAQGYWEKFRGRSWSDMPPPETDIDGAAGRSRSFDIVRQAFQLARRGGVGKQAVWRHPNRGTGQIFERLHQEIDHLGGRVQFHARVRSIKPQENGGFEVVSEENGNTLRRRTSKLVSAIPLESLVGLLEMEAAETIEVEREFQRSVILVYLFLDRPPKFPHAWLEVNDPAIEVGRITNFSVFSSDMVPDNHGALCVEYFCFGDSPLMTLSEDDITVRALKDLGDAELIDPGSVVGSTVHKLKRTNAAASWREQKSEHRAKILQDLTHYRDLFYTNRPGSDWASFAGMLAGRAILTGCRENFDCLADPAKRHSESVISARSKS